MKGHYSENTYGGIGGKFNRQGGSIHGNIGRTYTAGGQVDVNGRKVGANGSLNGELNGNIGYNKRTGITGQIGGKGQAHVGAQVGNVGAQANLRVNIGIGNKNGHLGVNAGIHGGLDIKTGNGRNIHIGKQAIKNGNLDDIDYALERYLPLHRYRDIRNYIYSDLQLNLFSDNKQIKQISEKFDLFVLYQLKVIIYHLYLQNLIYFVHMVL